MGSPASDGPDGSSIKPVSSLLARFENLNQSTPSATPHAASARAISPAPKPDRLRNFKPVQETHSFQSSALVLPAPKSAKSPPKSTPLSTNESSSSSTSSRDHEAHQTPHVSPRAQTNSMSRVAAPVVPPPPALHILPPESPPKGLAQRMMDAAPDQSPFLDPEAAVAPHELPSSTPISLQLPNRSKTPNDSLSTPLSHRRTSSGPPSPPPPRRSGELNRDGKQQAPPPPSPRLDKARNVPPTSSTTSDALKTTQVKHRKSSLTNVLSPFSSPPGSPDKETLGEAPPKLPARPRPRPGTMARHQSHQNNPGLSSTGLEHAVPAAHRQVVGQRIDRDPSIYEHSKSSLIAQRTGERSHYIPPKRSSRDLSSYAYHVSKAIIAMPPPPQPPRPAQRDAPKPSTLSSAASTTRPQQHRTTLQYAPPPPRAAQCPSRVVELNANRDATTGGIIPRSFTGRSTPRKGSPEGHVAIPGPIQVVTAFPDNANVNRRPPYVTKGCCEVQTKYDAKMIDVCGELVCTSGQLTRLWDIVDGEQLMSLSHTEGVRATSVSFKPAADPEHEGSFLWIGTNFGELMEVETATQRITELRAGVHGKAEITNIYRHYNELWSLDDGGSLILWLPGSDGVPSLNSQPIIQASRIPRGHTFSLVVGDELWHATGKLIRVFEPSADGIKPCQVLVRPLSADGCGDVSAGTTLGSAPGMVFFGHVDGKVSMFSTSDYTCQKILNVSSWKINGLCGVGNNMWAAYNTGKICVYDTAQEPWIIKKEWQAHEQSVLKMKTDCSGPYRMERLQVFSLGADAKVKIWDGMLQDNWLEDDLKSKDIEYCEFEEIKAMVFTWNAGASTPHSMRYSNGDASFFKDLLQSSGSPDILVFGFQELVDLEDKTATAKRLFKSKKKEGSDQERMSHQYRDWRDFLLKSLDDYMPSSDLYHLLQSTPLVGLFTCVFVKSSLRDRVRNLNAAEVKRGMGGLHGNKGAVAVRFKVDDTSLCFVNCHLAAGQSHANSRHNDIAAILEASLFPSEHDPEIRLDTFTGGGDGSMILDHELCILNGDLNYRIDTMSRDTVVKAVQQQQLSKLLERDQLLVARRRNPTFRLRAFEELPITFSPTYKYDVGTDTYDTSEKRRSPAWCDRVLFRGRGRVRQLDYTRHEVRVSDHRPVTGSFRLWVKKVDPRGRSKAWMESQQRFETAQSQVIANEKLAYLIDTCGFDQATSQKLIKEGTFQRVHRRSLIRDQGGGQ
ncbi:hypothetical protein E4U43_007157 [Claviceps pusilla]|uniref:Inositol polyphosphate-related phosphatase domain-containing protein n=1 Tax=Claviceps pusilla TaxID=123648 RepID=A0A9P7T142_9HYPO|nr:hypothetical protein E4U43_007157 [Claviceps pusilla]